MVREWSIQRDDRRLRELYPETAKSIMPYIEEACDGLEYNGSRMYDEFPDKWMLQKMSAEIYEKAVRELQIETQREDASFAEQDLVKDDEIFATDIGTARHSSEDHLRDLIDVLVCHEMFSRRCRQNQCKRCRR